ncbi:putative nucleotide-diphospho-sugar transferase [Okeania sp. SIO2B3]|uniref:putative nucleotide-diphospho-sugar transferase n=1 Tax=Okeania sp. SIO2B3 TaxID=2607784 RepID=UPI0013C1C492|nr:putative nucleotide-diphospho-sugar transferase [Okeania sp. SIO2B3]NET42558.1 hypothetical protein [Okeania sp. SIO2B3]
MNNHEIGYLYVATGDKYIQEAIVSATSLKKLNKSVHITLVTDRKINNSLFDKIVIHPVDIKHFKEGLLYKVRHIYQASPYEKTLFVDTDTYFCDDCQEIFETLDFFDLAVAPDPTDPHKAKSPKTNKKLAACETYNTGVILFKKSLNNELFFQKWLEIYESKIINKTVGKENDQTSFIEAWLESNCKMYVLSHAWNARTPFFFTMKDAVKIIHGRHRNYETIKNELNRLPGPQHRCWLPIQKRCIKKNQGWEYQLSLITDKIKEYLKL